MLFARYQLTLFSAWGRPLLSLKLHGVFFLLPPLLLLALAAGNGFLSTRYAECREMALAQNLLDSQRRELSRMTLSQAAAVGEMEERIRQTTDFNDKLRIMLNIGAAANLESLLRISPLGNGGLSRLPALYGRSHMRDMHDRVKRLQGDLLHEEVRQQRIAHAIADQLETLGTIPVIMPTRGRFSSPFGWRTDPFTGGRRFHKGIDLTARTGTPVRVTANGVVTQVSRSPSYGLVIVVTHSEELRTRYAHLSKFVVEEGQRVLRGQIIGHVGNTGRSMAPHLHYEVHQRGKPVNPRNYILQ